MACWLKQSTAADVMLGPFLDSADGNTVEGGLTITQPDIRLSKNGGAFAQKSAAQTLTHGENGWYPANLSTTDTNTLGVLVVAVHESGALPVWREFLVVPANVYDSFFSTDLLQVDLTQLLGSAIATPTVAGVIETDQTHYLGSASPALVGGRFDSSVGAIAANAVTATALNADAITAAKVADGAIDAATFAAGAINAAAMNADMNSYTTRTWLAKESTAADKYIVQWAKNGQILTSGITLPKIRVFDEDGTDLIAETAMTEIGSTQSFKFEELTDTLTPGEIYMVEAKATIDGSVRLDRQPVMRDSA